MTERCRRRLGWTAVTLSSVAACFWAFWGIVENFHEGWHHPSLGMNLGMLLVHYLLPMWLFVATALTAIRWPRVGGGAHVATAMGAAWFFRGASPAVLLPFIVGPLFLMGVCYWLGRPRPRRWAAAAVTVLPLLTLVAAGIGPALRVAGRFDDGDRSARRITQNGLDLVWAPEGPGWPRVGVSWEEAKRCCRHLSEDGTTLAPTPQDVWRLPTADEAVRSMQRRGQNSGGSWDARNRRASYERTPDKESPLWDVHSPVIYWWTATEANDEEALIIVYDGRLWPRPRSARWGSLGFRAVKDAPAPPEGRRQEQGEHFFTALAPTAYGLLPSLAAAARSR
jgi:hypothetical protein